jgi:hypothetical protein
LGKKRWRAYNDPLRKGQRKSGISNDEHKRNDPTGNNAKAERKADEPG